MKKIKPLIALDTLQQCNAVTKGFEKSFIVFFMGHKTLGTLTPLIQWHILSRIFGNRINTYGIDALTSNIFEWPNPMIILFPKVTKCEMVHEGYSTKIVYLCEFSGNDTIKWFFFFYWWWIVLVFFVNVLSLLYICFNTIPCFRQYQFRRSSGAGITQNNIGLQLGFSNWLMLRFLDMNLNLLKYIDFLRTFVASTNNDLSRHM